MKRERETWGVGGGRTRECEWERMRVEEEDGGRGGGISRGESSLP